ncbi:MAG: hypothetical protein L0323_01100 [Planctomycetes bacterium]|nr:hypothetical protein [Planctomycetota bacterium]
MHESALRRAFEEGRKEVGPLPLPFETFARRVAEVPTSARRGDGRRLLPA